MSHPDTGGGGTSGPGRAVPLTSEQRADNYRRQNGSERLTPRQRRRAQHKRLHAAVRGTFPL